MLYNDCVDCIMAPPLTPLCMYVGRGVPITFYSVVRACCREGLLSSVQWVLGGRGGAGASQFRELN